MKKPQKGKVGRAISDFLSVFFSRKLPKTSLIIPAYNEEKTIAHVIKQAKLVREISEIIVVDDGSRDRTANIAKDLGAEVIKHHKNLGKGEAIKTGISHARGTVMLFLDADLQNITDKKISALITPILKDKADFTKAAFTRAGGRVTEFAVKPMMKMLYPESQFKQPISGQFAGKKSFLNKIKIEPKWGIDIAILLDAIKHGQRVAEVNIGELVHKRNSDSEIAEMSQQIMETILKKAGYLCSKHKIIFFTDNTLFSKGFTQNSERFLEALSKKKIKIIYLTKNKLKKFEGHKKYINKIYEIGHEKNSNKILNIIKKISKRYGAGLEECVLFVNVGYFKPITKKVGLSLCFTNSPEELKEKSKVLHSLSDTFLFLE